MVWNLKPNLKEIGKIVYGKKINVGALPNATTVRIEHNIPIGEIVGFDVYGKYNSNASVFKLNFVSSVENSTTINLCVVIVTKTHINITSNYNISFANGEVTIYYTKN